MEPSAPPSASAASTGAGLLIPEAALAHLVKARAWSRFLAVMGFLSAGFASLALAALLFGPLPVAGAGLGGSAFRATTTMSYALMIVGSMVLAAFLWGYANKLASFASGNAAALAEAFRNLRLLWTAGVVLYALNLLLGVAVSGLNASGLLGGLEVPPPPMP